MRSEALGKELKALRLRAGFSEREAARRIGLSSTRLRDFEAGFTRGQKTPAIPKREQLVKLAKLYQHPLENLLVLAGYPIEEAGPPEPPTREQLEAREVADIYLRLGEPHRRLLLHVARAFKDEATNDGAAG